MRTTIEIDDRHRAALLDLAGRRGQKGFSGIVAEAIEEYLAGHAAREARAQRALRTEGALDGPEADEFASRVHAARSTWRTP